MFQTTQQLAEKGTHETVCHGTSVNAICYMAQRRKCRTQYGNKSIVNFYNDTILRYLQPILNHTVFTYTIGHCSTMARYIALLFSEVIDFIIFFAPPPLPSVCWWFILLRYFVSCYCSNQRLLNGLSILRQLSRPVAINAVTLYQQIIYLTLQFRVVIFLKTMKIKISYN